MANSLRYLLCLVAVFLITATLSLIAQEKPVKIGVLIPGQSSEEVIHAAQLAIHMANNHGGFRDQHFELTVRTTEGPWGAGSKQSVALVYEDSVWAILGSLDGRNAHLAEQVAVKSHITYLETRATESTLSQAYVPWFFRCVPSDDQQSIAILQHLRQKDQGNVAILSTDENDSRQAAKSFIRVAARKKTDNKAPFLINPDEFDFRQIFDKLNRANIRHLIVTVHSEATIEIIRLMKERMPEIFIYGTHSFTTGIHWPSPNCNAYDGMTLISAEILLSQEGKQFQQLFQNKYGYKPGISAFHAYDGTNLIIQAIRNAGLNREAIKDYIAETRFSGWTTGPISFDELGNRINSTLFTQLQK